VSFRDGSFVSGCDCTPAKRWFLLDDDTDNNDNNRNQGIQLVCTYGTPSKLEGYFFIDAVELDNDTFLTVCRSNYTYLQLWNKTTSECLRSSEPDYGINCLISTKNKLHIVCGRYDGFIEMRRIDDLKCISSFGVHSRAVVCICELSDGSFVSGFRDSTIKRWNEKGIVLQTFSGHSEAVVKVIELRSDIIVASS